MAPKSLRTPSELMPTRGEFNTNITRVAASPDCPKVRHALSNIMAPSNSHPPLAFVHARLIDPENGMETRGGVLVEDGLIKAFGPEVAPQNLPKNMTVIDCRGDVLSPGLIDLRVSLSDGVADASVAAAAGGVTTILAGPNDDPAALYALSQTAREKSCVRILPVGSLTKGLRGSEIAEMGLLREAGAVAFSEGTRSVASSHMMRCALSCARDLDALVVHFPVDRDLAASSVMNDGELAVRLGLAGAPREAESIALFRDISLVRMTGARYCAAPISTTLSLDIIARAKTEGLDVSCAATINHLTLNENDIGDFSTFAKLNPPLRRDEERLALVEALASGLIDMVFSDHDPQDARAKDQPFSRAAFGAVGLETLLAAGLRLVHAELISLPRLLRAMTSRPAEILRLPQGRLKRGAPADLILFDPDEPFVLDRAALKSRCKNTPFDKARLQGIVKATMVAGHLVHGAKANLEC
jgi:dihydroorotase